MDFIRAFTAITKADVAIAGGKGASLGELTRAGIPVPQGFVILSSAFERFIQETQLDVEIDSALHQVKHEEMHTVERASEQIQALIMGANIPQDIASAIQLAFEKLNARFVAVRSSATAEDSSTAAWAGQLESYLNTTEKDFLENVKRCWASLFTPRAIFYRFEKGLHKEKILVAVVVQKMVESEMSGIAFSVHPVTQDYNQLIIEACCGLGEAIVSGQITPDSYIVEKNPRRIIDKHIVEQEKGLFKKKGGGNEWYTLGETGKKQVLTEKQILELSELAVKIEKHYGFPCDIEWALEKEKFYIVQSRPITTLTEKKNSPSKISILKRESVIGHPSEYQLLFQLLGLPYLVNDTLAKNYAQLRCLFIYANGRWTSYLPKEVIEKTLQEGVLLFSDKTRFLKYKEDFEEYKKESAVFFESITKKERLLKEDVEKFLGYITKLHHFYIKTEFFYTDDAFLQSKKNELIRENLHNMDFIKNSGREHLNKIFFGNEGYITRVLLNLSSQFNIPLDALFQYTQEELLDLFAGKYVDDSLIAASKQAYISVGDGIKVKNYIGEEAKSLADAFSKEEDAPTAEIKGVSANKGKVRGRVKLMVYRYDSFDKVKHMIEEMHAGDILVADTTSPELLPACKKASAILTNQGGLLSHAAIVSRELNIPCIVGLGKVTHLVKDDDLVEVDADKGIVRILKKGEEKT